MFDYSRDFFDVQGSCCASSSDREGAVYVSDSSSCCDGGAATVAESVWLTDVNFKKESSCIPSSSKRLLQRGSSSMEFTSSLIHHVVQESTVLDGKDIIRVSSPSRRLTRIDDPSFEFSGENCLQEELRGVGRSGINLLPITKVGSDGLASVADISAIPLKEDQGDLISNHVLNHGEGLCNINYSYMYACLLARLKLDLFGSHVPTLTFNIEEEFNYSNTSRWDGVAAFHPSACKVGRRESEQDGGPGNSFPILADQVACMNISTGAIFSSQNTQQLNLSPY